MTDEMDILEGAFNDGDLADPENLPEKVKFIGQITEVDMTAAKQGNFRKFEKGLKDGRTEVPIITLKIRALRYADGRVLDEGKNFMAQLSADYWVGSVDTIGRHALASLCEKVRGYSKEEMKMKSLGSLASELKNGYVTFEVVWQEADQATFQKARKIKAASNDEIALIG